MSGLKLDLQWSPFDDDIFITFGTAINLYQAKERDGIYETINPDNKLSPKISQIVLLATSSDLQFMKCVAWCPRVESKNVFAVAQTNGRISMVSIGQQSNDDLVGKEFNIRYNRQCNYLAWNPSETHLLAQGLERSRNEPCVLIWDVNSSSIDLGERTRHSASEGPVTKPALELGSGESSSSFSWFTNDPKCFVVGMANKHLRVYDLRDTTRPHQDAQHICVSGICIDPMEPYRLASYCENQVAIWDTRSFDRPINIITENKNVVKISWCPTKQGILSVLTKESSHVKLHDIRHSLFSSEEIEQSSIERNIQPFNKSHLASFSWHPRQENRLLSVLPNGSVRDMTIYDRIPMEWSSNLQLTMPVSKDIIRCLEETDLNKDISTVMRKRISQNYGLEAQDIAVNMKAVEDEPQLHGLWRWIFNIRVLIASQTASSKHRIPYATGVISLLHIEGDDVNLNSEPVATNWKASENIKYSKRTHYRSNERTMALQLCGWTPDYLKEGFDAFIEKLVKSGSPERASAIALFYLHIKKALEILSIYTASTEQGEGSPNLKAVAMALSGFTEDKNALWRRTCGTLRYQLKNPYLRAIFAFLACDEDNYDDVLDEEDMAVEDRVAFALIYLPDAKLKTYLCKLSEELIKAGDLDGILLTGMYSKGVDLLGNYLDLTSDIQTAAIAAVFSMCKEQRISEWIDVYRDLLDRWRFWHQRCIFDNVRQTFYQDRVPPSVNISCNFCGKSISNTIMTRARSMVQTVFNRGAQIRPKITCCPSCRKALPRCAICLTHMGTSSGSGAKLTPIQEWFTWCQTCRHGGHAAHLIQWFSEHSECPVTGCTCKCIAQDKVKLQLPHVNDNGNDVSAS
ncbi:GATOR complex protein MIOS-A-like isoform X2 [Physella acuta]|uniref:GATOR complex protein MIOS-A-like isoform X2 n=1 Tax=Physella acuta TaxID=109671 RepID=UPI0027DC6CD4|nr:GATOR complex protein MIOS-A-like isoform X2 [Physella acuta]